MWLDRIALFLGVAVLATAAHAANCPTSSEGLERVGTLAYAVRDRVIVRPTDLVTFRKIGRQIIQGLLNDLNVHLKGPEPSVREIGGIGAFLIDVPGYSTDQLLTALDRPATFQWRERDYIVLETATPNDTFYPRWSLTKIGAPTAWDKTQGSREIVVAVIDSGMQLSHPDLVDNIWSAHAPFSVTIGANNPISCPAGSAGYDIFTQKCMPGESTGHGTLVGGIIGGVGNNGFGVVGVNWKVQMMPLRFIGEQRYGCISDAVDMLEFARQTLVTGVANVRVINMSWGVYAQVNSLRSELALVHASNILSVAAAGNNSSDNDGANPFYPATYVADVLSVTGTDMSDALVSVSNYGSHTVHFGAPGMNIVSTSMVPTSPYKFGGGTSVAAAHASGAAALVLSVCTSLSADQLKALLVGSVDASAGLSGKTISGGRLNVSSAIVQCAPH